MPTVSPKTWSGQAQRGGRVLGCWPPGTGESAMNANGRLGWSHCLAVVLSGALSLHCGGDGSDAAEGEGGTGTGGNGAGGTSSKAGSTSKSGAPSFGGSTPMRQQAESGQGGA